MKKILFALLTVSIALASCNKKNEPENSDAPQNDETSGTVKDICGNTYNYVKIGEQYWMAENMRCNKYDTESERPNATIATTSESYSYAPYFINASDKSTWDNDCLYSESLTDTQIQKLGYLYNWAAAVGLETEADALAQVTEFNGKRQGICPNEWHIPTKAEWNVLKDYAGGQNIAGKKLKATSGWSNADGYLIPGVDAFGFAALPAASGNGNHIGCLGIVAYFWTATPGKEMTSSNKNDASYFYMYGDANELLDDGMSPTKNQSFSVRCVKNDSNSTDEENTSPTDDQLTANIVANQNYKGVFIMGGSEDDTAIMIFRKSAATGVQEFACSILGDNPVATDPTSIYLVGTWVVKNGSLTLNITSIYGYPRTATISGAIENMGDKFTLKTGNMTFKDMEATGPQTDTNVITLNIKTATLLEGESYTITAKTNTAEPIVWTTSNSTVASISAVGNECKVTAIAAGETQVKASIAGKEAVCNVTVIKPALKFDKTSLMLKVGESGTVEVLNTGTDLRWGVEGNAIKSGIKFDGNKATIIGIVEESFELIAWSGEETVYCKIIVISDNNPAGTASFNVQFDIPEGIDTDDIVLTVEGIGSGQRWEKVADLTYDDNLNSWNASAEVPEAFIFKIVISYKNGSKIYQSGDNIAMPVDRIVNLSEIQWERDPFAIPSGTGTFTITLSSNCKATSADKVIFTGNFETDPWLDSDRIMTNDGSGSYRWTGRYPENFIYKIILRTEGKEDQWIGPANSWKFDGKTFTQNWDCGL